VAEWDSIIAALLYGEALASTRMDREGRDQTFSVDPETKEADRG
jgi:hypothetical protein